MELQILCKFAWNSGSKHGTLGLGNMLVGKDFRRELVLIWSLVDDK